METQAKFPFLIHIYNEDYGDFYFVNSDTDIVYDSHTYRSAFFSVSRGEKTQTSIGNATLTMSALPDDYGNNWIERIRNTQKRSILEFVAGIQVDGSIEPLEILGFTLTSVSWTETTITWSMEFDDSMKILIPCDICGMNITPGCA